MKPINSLSALVSSATSNLDSSSTSSNQLRAGGGGSNLTFRKESVDRDNERQNESFTMTNATPANTTSAAATGNPSPVESSASSGSGLSSSILSQGEKMDKKLLSSSQETPLSVLKISPLSMFINNKVGSSFHQHNGLLGNYRQNLQQAAILQQQQSISSQLPVSDRKVRDSGSLLFMLAFLGFLGYIIWDGLVVKETDINLIVHGHDSFGNICGRNNKPIGFVKRSGKNYTDKPFTKYTLINSQFERYTLDSSRLKKGELYYIKQLDDLDSELGPEEEGRKSGNGSSLISSHKGATRGRRSAPSAPQEQKEQQQSISINLDSLRHNQTALKDLKSSFMYQYPAQYGYIPKERTNKTVPFSSASASTDSLGTGRQQQQQEENSGISNDNSSKMSHTNATEKSNNNKATAVLLSLQQEKKVASNQQQFGTSVDDVDELEASHSEPRGTALRPLATGPHYPTSLFMGTSERPRLTTQRMVVFDDHATNESDSYEDHMLITPTVTSTQPLGSSPKSRGNWHSEIPSSEVSSQLLYLTECVDHCPAEHVELIFYRCMPKNWRFSLFPNAINVTRTFIDDILTDMSHCYRELIYIFSLALVLSLALLILLRFLASAIIWSCITLLVGLFISLASYSWLSYYYQIIDLNNSMPHDSVYADRLASSDKWLVGSIFLTFVSFAMIGTVVFMRKRILLVTTLFKESGKAIADMPLLLLQPVLTFAALLLITAAWSVGLICLQSMKMPVIDMSTGFVVFKAEAIYKLMKWYHIFAFLWVSHFAIACQHYVIGASVSKWYFSTQRYNLNSPIGTSVAELILYYLGSVALGSFLVAIFKVIRIVVRQIQFLVQRNCMAPSAGGDTGAGFNALEGSTNQHQAGMTSGSSFCGSCSYVWRLFIWFFDNIVMIINRDAYVEIAIHGHGFLSGAKRAFALLASNPLKLLAVKSVSNVLLVVAKISVVFGTVSMAIILLEEKTHQLNYSWSPVVISALYAYIVAHWFLSVYEMVIDALFICYCEDYERNKKRHSFQSLGAAAAAATENQINGSNFMTQILSNSNQVY